jgi:colanic acid biosynthesis glycosyl transferase WcaI
MSQSRRVRHSTDRSQALRILVHDYGGYPFIIQLSRALAERGHEILHLFPEGFRQPRGQMEVRQGDAPTLSVEPLRLREVLRRGGLQRISQELRFSKLLADRTAAFRPDLVISANSPLDVQAAAAAAARQCGAAFVFWLQDLHSVAISKMLGRRVRLLGTLSGFRFARLERRLLRESDAVVVISADFLPHLRQWEVPMGVVEVIENWAPLEDDPSPRESDQWATEHGLGDGRIVIYAGTLALKHNPALLLDLAVGLPDVVVAVVAEGPGADWLRIHGEGVSNLRLLALEPYASLPAMLARADLLVAVLEPDASSFSAPSKVLTYLAAGRAILAAVPEANAAAKIITRTGAGVVVDPEDPAAMVAAARQLLADPDRLRAAGVAGRAYAQQAFDIDRITKRFEWIFRSAVRRKANSRVVVAAESGQASDTADGP